MQILKRLFSNSLFLLLILLMPGSPAVYGAETASIDLRDKQWGAGQVFSLDGTWRFTRGAFLAPANPAADPAASDSPFPIPGFWNDAPLSQQTNGFGTLHTQVRVPAGKPLYMALSDVPAAYRLFINGELSATVGTPAASPDLESPHFLPQLISIPATDGVIEVVIHVSNFHYKQGGVRRSILITDESGYYWLKDWPMLFDIFFSGVLITIGLSLLAQRLIDRDARAATFLGLFCLVIGTRALLVGERILYQVDGLPWSVLQKAEHIFLYFGMASFVYYLYELLEGQISKRLPQLVGAYCVVLSLLTLIFPVKTGTLTVIPFKVGALAISVFVAARYVPRLRQFGPGVQWFRLSVVVLVSALVIDLLMNQLQIHNRPVVHWGLILFVVLQVTYLWQLRANRLKQLGPLTDHSSGVALSGLLPRSTPLFEGLYRELGDSRKRIRDLESRLRGEHGQLAGQQTLTYPSSSAAVHRHEAHDDRRDSRALLTELLRFTLNLWERHTGKSKVQLAEQSGCWRVYMDGSTPKTRTLDKYLNPKTLPKNPRWRLVVRTSHYVIAHCDLSKDERTRLDRMIQGVEHALS
ncbi:7TM diverse intracellular signaling domain-containing protein [Marinobacter sp. V034]|uniref:7TM diverse intracellular signaling domain-containing protein n=1 Tax=Marinobacter sp. V034 TaxID=3459610 RepID=UPI004044EF81